MTSSDGLTSLSGSLKQQNKIIYTPFVCQYVCDMKTNTFLLSSLHVVVCFPCAFHTQNIIKIKYSENAFQRSFQLLHFHNNILHSCQHPVVAFQLLPWVPVRVLHCGLLHLLGLFYIAMQRCGAMAGAAFASA